MSGLKLSPSDFAYLFEECKLCYWLKVKRGIYQPSMPMPGVFSAINTRLQTPLIGKELREVSSTLPPGRVVNQEGWVESIVLPGTNLFIKGKYDLLVDNGDGTHMLVDLKISQADEGKIEKYQTQLSAYKYALEHPASGQPIIISRMGLLIFYPDTVMFRDGTAQFTFPPTWLEVPADDERFLTFIRGVNEVLSGPVPQENPSCKWCQYRHIGDQFAHQVS